MKKEEKVTFNDVEVAYERISHQVHQTPILTSNYLDKLTRAKLYFKCENFQKVGAFKIRGALNSVKKLQDLHIYTPLVTHSSGNHGQALALAGSLCHYPVHVVMPIDSSKIKIDAVKSYGASVHYCQTGIENRELEALKILDEVSGTMIHPYSEKSVIEGQGTVAYEFLSSMKDLDILLVPVGGGGLISGCSLVAKTLSPKTLVYGVEPKALDDASRSYARKVHVIGNKGSSIADGLRANIGKTNFKYILEYVDGFITVKEESLIKAMKTVWERMKIIIEPSAAVTLAAVLDFPDIFYNKKVGLILSGGNLDLENLPWQSI
ncbi:MAG: serine dehydratase [Zetaproteobacteria bacterium]|nr:serine dehydratase [Pseudobdellovibrionaceae bacterium]|tara:strand:- start:1103 stop:2065 length:963 start_codon:yes stop_codon:yes gene_type:complete